MGKTYPAIDAELASWIRQQRLFFVATAPLGAEGHVNCSPKGLDTFRITGPDHVAYLDLTGSGAETIAHLRENGRIVFLFCAFSGPPRIVRLHGRGRVLTPASTGWESAQSHFREYFGARSIIEVQVTRIGDSCGYGVPRYEHLEDRDTLDLWARKKGQQGVAAYQEEKNARSIDGLPALERGPAATPGMDDSMTGGSSLER